MILYIFAFIFGAAIGSFLNVCIFRLPLEQSIVSPSSHCFSCKKPIAFYDNVPLISFIFLKGKCRHCKAPFSYQYPLVELLTGILAFASVLMWGFTINALSVFIFLAALIAITFIDIEYKIIPDVISLPGILYGLLAALVLPRISFLDSFFGVLLGGGSLLLVAGLYYLLTKQEGMGLGDVKLLAMMGAFLGWQSILFIVMIGSMTGAVIGIVAMLIKKKDRKYAIPFGPFLSLGAVSYLFFGQDIISWYVNIQLWLGSFLSRQ
jgi:leader peptidase (prepilin peptidase)/N-methyltransferase